MSSILEKITIESEWKEFLNVKEESLNLSKQDKLVLKKFVEEKHYLNFTKDKLYSFSFPQKKLINKLGKKKKRIVYSFSENETILLKFIVNKLYKYDYLFSPNLYSFRKSYSVRDAILKLTRTKNIDLMFGYKLDIKDYFNSININLLIDILKEVLYDDIDLYEFFKYLLLQNKSIFNGQEIVENRGAMAGVPLAVFFANIYLIDLDKYFYDNNIVYVRYSDDIILFAEDKNTLNKCVEFIKNTLEKKFLSVNSDKEFYFNPRESWNFLGFQYSNKKIDLSPITIQKMKGKIRRKARGIYRWKLRKNVDNAKAMKAMIKVFNKKFFDNYYKDEINWSKWYFPIINTSNGLKIIDEYLQQYIRYIVTGRHSKKNYNVRYEDLKALGYRSLVNEFYKFKKCK